MTGNLTRYILGKNNNSSGLSSWVRQENHSYIILVVLARTEMSLSMPVYNLLLLHASLNKIYQEENMPSKLLGVKTLSQDILPSVSLHILLMTQVNQTKEKIKIIHVRTYIHTLVTKKEKGICRNVTIYCLKTPLLCSSM